MGDKTHQQRYGWFSYEQKLVIREPRYDYDTGGKMVFRGSTSSIYLTPDNNEVEVTTVTISPENHGTRFDDMGPCCRIFL